MNRNTSLGIGVGLLLILMALVTQEAASIDSVKLSTNIVSQATTETQMSKLATANNRFGFNLFSQINTQQPEKNLVISPNSIAIALAMARTGTQGTTQAEITKALELAELDPTAIDASYLKLIETLKTADSKVKIAIANSLWVNQNITVQQQFINNAQKFYQAEVSNLNFANSQATDTINNWVANNTANKITEIVDSVSVEDALYLINAIYFKGSWTNKFNASATTEQPFYTKPDASQPQLMMNQSGEYRYYQSDRFTAIRLPYGEKQELAMYIFLPTETSNLAEFNQQLNLENWQEWLVNMRSQPGKITMPRFQLEYEADLKPFLVDLGIESIFDPSQADFSAMTDIPVAIDTVKHKTFIEVNEEGTEAAAVTSIGIRITSAQPQTSFDMNVNRPFFFAIRDDVTETILFMGNVIKP